MIIEAYGDFVRVKHVVSMRLVNPNKASKEKTTIACSHIIKTTHDFFQRLIKQSQSFETSHATAKTTKHTIKTTSSMICKSLSRSLNKLPFVPV
jgi:hydrogenase maturation factor HypF (carbamoyltransferase family)